MFSTESSQQCQSRYFKEWHPDYIGAYSSLSDPHLKRFFGHPARRRHLSRNNQVTASGDAVSEREWRKQNLEWERRRREAQEVAAQRTHQRDVDERRARMVLRQQQKDEDSARRKRERDKLGDDGGDQQQEEQEESHIRQAWADQAALIHKISKSNRSDVEQLLNFLNLEMEYLLRPRSAPLR